MAHYAKMTSDGLTVLVVHVVRDEDTTNDDGDETEEQGIKFLKKLHNWDYWRKTSFNTQGGVHLLGGTPYRKNYASIGYTYDSEKDAFIPPKPFNSWVLNESTCLWVAPTPPGPPPDDDNIYHWDEDNTQWVQFDQTG